MRTVNIHEAKTNLSSLIEGVTANGEGFIIAKAGRPVARVIPMAEPQRVGFLAGRISVPDDFDRMGEGEIVSLFEGGE